MQEVYLRLLLVVTYLIYITKVKVICKKREKKNVVEWTYMHTIYGLLRV
jgi:hypothetical protein